LLLECKLGSKILSQNARANVHILLNPSKSKH